MQCNASLQCTIFQPENPERAEAQKAGKSTHWTPGRGRIFRREEPSRQFSKGCQQNRCQQFCRDMRFRLSRAASLPRCFTLSESWLQDNKPLIRHLIRYITRFSLKRYPTDFSRRDNYCHHNLLQVFDEHCVSIRCFPEPQPG